MLRLRLLIARFGGFGRGWDGLSIPVLLKGYSVMYSDYFGGMVMLKLQWYLLKC